MSVWAPAHVYTAGDIVDPITSTGHSYRCLVGGTSDNTEPSWVTRYQTVTDGMTVEWVVYTVVTPGQVRAMLNLDPEATGATTPAATGQYSDDTIGGYLLDAISSLEQSCRRFFANRPGFTFTQTSQTAATMPLPGLRTLTSITYAGVTMNVTAEGGPWLLPDAQQTGVYTGVQFRPFRSPDNGPWWLVLGGPTNNWFDTGADNPFDPRNYGGGYVYTSMPNDQVTVGDWGYAPGFEPGNFVHALEILAGWYVMRPPAILNDSAVTATGAVVSYSQMPPEVQEFVRSFSAGRMAVSIG